MTEFSEGYLFALEQVQKQIIIEKARMAGADYPQCCGITAESELDALYDKLEEVKKRE